MRATISAIVLPFILAGCGQALAATIDPNDDVHCFVLAFYFHGLAKHQKAPDKQVRAAEGLQHWYSGKMKVTAAERLEDPASFEKEAGPLLQTVNDDPLAMREKVVRCADRAVADPAFNRFASGYVR